MPTKKKKQKTGEELEQMIENGKDISEHLPERLEKNFVYSLTQQKKEKNVVRTTVDLGADVVESLQEIADTNNISRAAVLKMAVFDYVMRFRQYKKD